MLPHEDPVTAFADWYAEACAHEPRVPEAMQVATVGADGRPSLRTVLMKSFDADGVVFYTNLGSRKARELAERPVATALFHWKSLERQVIVEGVVDAVTDEEADAYFATRPRGSRLGAWASRQSQPVDARDALLAAVAEVEARFGDGPVPRPPFWSGFRVVPDRWEFWQGMADRLHVRTVYGRVGGGWRRGLLQP